jgi:hypothetical protein
MTSSNFNGEEFQKFFQDNQADCLDMYLQPSQVSAQLIISSHRYGFRLKIGPRVVFEQPATAYYQQDVAIKLRQFLLSLIDFVTEQSQRNQAVAQLIAAKEAVLTEDWLRPILRDLDGPVFIDKTPESVWSLDSRYMAIM